MRRPWLAGAGQKRLCQMAGQAILLSLTVSSPALAQVCAIGTSPISFGSVSGLSAAPTSSGQVGVSCTSGPVSYIISLSYGSGAGANGLHRYMTSSGGAEIPYHIYRDSLYQNLWGDSVGVNTVSGTNSGSLQLITEYAEVLSMSGVVPGTYTDNVTGTLVYSGGSPTSAFTVSVTVTAACSVTATALNFGSVAAPIASAVTSTATITALCTNTTPYSIGLGNGANASGSQRRMQQGSTGQYVSYNLYTNSGYSQPWSGTTSATSCTNGSGTCVLGTGSGSNQSITVYGKVPAQSSPAVGTYADTVVVTLTY